MDVFLRRGGIEVELPDRLQRGDLASGRRLAERLERVNHSVAGGEEDLFKPVHGREGRGGPGAVKDVRRDAEPVARD